jgi:hypothetical protein
VKSRGLRRLLLAACVLAGTWTAPGAAGSQPGRSSSIADLLTGYVDWVQGRRTGVELIATDLDVARGNLSRFDPSYLPSRLLKK